MKAKICTTDEVRRILNGATMFREPIRPQPEGDGLFTAAELFKLYAADWDRRHAKRGLGWDLNPWAWPVVYERCEKGE